MSNKIQATFVPGETLYLQLQRDSDSYVWNGTTFVSFANADWASYALATVENPIGSGRYFCTVPSGIPAGDLSWTVFLQLDPDDPDIGDSRAGIGGDYWNGTSFGDGTPVVLAPNGMDAVILEPATDTTPEINARQGLALVYDSAPGGQISGVQSTNPIKVKNPSGEIDRMTIQADPKGNRLNITINNMP